MELGIRNSEFARVNLLSPGILCQAKLSASVGRAAFNARPSIRALNITIYPPEFKNKGNRRLNLLVIFRIMKREGRKGKARPQRITLEGLLVFAVVIYVP
jgi:hypothetical protein